MNFDQHIPVDKGLIRRVKNALDQSMAAYDQHIEYMQELEDQLSDMQSATDIPVEFLDAEDRPIAYYSPESMYGYRAHMAAFSDDLIVALKKSESAQDQMSCMFGLLKECYGLATLSGNIPLICRWADQVVNRVAVAYEDRGWRTRRAENEVADNIERIGPSQRAYFQQSLGDLCGYSNLCLEGIADMEMLTLYQERVRGVPQDQRVSTPYGVALRRYCGTHEIEDHETARVADKDREKFFRDVKKFISTELYGKFADLYPQDKPCPEMAWFVAAAVDAVRIHEVELFYEKDQPRPRAVAALSKKSLQPANDGGSFVELVQGPRKEFIPGKFEYGANDIGRTDEEILADPESCQQIRDVLEDVMENYPQMATKFADMMGAKDYIQKVYLGVESEPSAEHSR